MAPDITETIIITENPKSNASENAQNNINEYSIKQRQNNNNNTINDNNLSSSHHSANNFKNTKNLLDTNEQLITLRRNHDFIADIRWPDLMAQLFIHGGAAYGLYLLFHVKFLTIVWCKYLLNNLLTF